MGNFFLQIYAICVKNYKVHVSTTRDRHTSLHGLQGNWSVDDMIVKSKTREERVLALGRFFEHILKYSLYLNPQKCAFWITNRKLLGLLISERGIEVDPENVKAIP